MVKEIFEIISTALLFTIYMTIRENKIRKEYESVINTLPYKIRKRFEE